jgi:ribosomal-protein-alanine N-acetyltransferase
MFSLFTGPEESFVRPMRPEHVPACVRIHAASFARGWAAEEFETLLRDKTVLAHVLTDGPGLRVEGFALSRKVLDEAELLTIAVDASLRGQGLGRQLLAVHLETLASAGARIIFLEVEEANAAARKLYDRAGFAVVGQRDGYYRKPDGSRARALVMRRNQ